MKALSLSKKGRYTLILVGASICFLMWRAYEYRCTRADGAVAPPCDPARIAAQGFNGTRLCAVLDEFHTAAFDFHGLIVERHGVVVAERYRAGKDRSVYSLFGHRVAFTADERHDMRSVSKSVTSLLFGIATQEHRVPALDTPVRDLFPQFRYMNEDGRNTITVAHLLDMTTGLDWDESGSYRGLNDESGLSWRSSQADYVLHRPLTNRPGTHFNYNGGSTAILAELMQRGTGMPIDEYARRRLFEPLGIHDWEWLHDLRGRPLAYSGLRMRPQDLVKIGRLMLQGGRWNQQQLVPADWVRKCLHPAVPTGDGWRYGSQWWGGRVRASGVDHDWIGALGNGGQRLIVVPALDLVVVVTAGMYDDEAGAIAVNRLFKKVVAAVDG